jgi:hypothetical protein
MPTQFEIMARDIVDLERSMRDHKHGEDTIRFAISNYIEHGFTALYDVWVSEDDTYIKKDEAYEYVCDNPPERY